MNELDIIFQNNKELMDTDEVKTLIEYYSDQYDTLYKGYKEHRDMYNAILDICMNSELIVKKGIPAKESIEKILQQYEEDN